MKHLFLPVYFLFALMSVAQQPVPAKTPPTLSTADKIAIQACEEAKGKAQQAYQQAQQQELAVEREFTVDHPGWHLNPQTYVVEADPKPEEKKVVTK